MTSNTPLMSRLDAVEVVELTPNTAWFVGFTRYRYAGTFTKAEALLVLTRHLARTIGWAETDQMLEKMCVAESSWYFHLDDTDPTRDPVLRNDSTGSRDPFGKPYWKGHVLSVDPTTFASDS